MAELGDIIGACLARYRRKGCRRGDWHFGVKKWLLPALVSKNYIAIAAATRDHVNVIYKCNPTGWMRQQVAQIIQHTEFKSYLAYTPNYHFTGEKATLLELAKACQQATSMGVSPEVLLLVMSAAWVCGGVWIIYY